MLLHLSILALILLVSLFFEKRIRTEKLVPALGGEPIINNKSSILPWVLVFALITFYAAVRNYTNDTEVYMTIFRKLEPSWENIFTILSDTSKDKGFYIFQNLFKMYISTDFHMWFLFFASVESIIIITFLRKRAVSFLDSMFFFFTSMLYFNYFSMMRQWFAVSLVLAAFTFVEKRKFIPYLIICIFAAQFHNSAYFMIPVYFLVQGKSWSPKQMSILGIFTVALVFIQPIISIIDSASQDLTYGYVVSSMSTNSGSSIIRAVVAVIPVILAYMGRKNFPENDNTINLCVNYSILYFLLALVASFTNGLYIMRLAVYFNLYNVILYPYILNLVYKDHPSGKIIKIGFYIFYFAFYMFDMTNSNAFPYFSDVIGLYK